MNTYIELKEREKLLLNQLQQIKQENIDIISELDELKEKFPNEFSVMSIDLLLLEPERILYRLLVVQDDIDLSKNISEEEKEIIKEKISLVGEKSNKKIDEYDNVKKQVINIAIDIEKRKDYVKERMNLIQEKKKEQEYLNKKMKYYESMIASEYAEPSIKEEAEKILTKIKIDQNLLQNEIDTIMEEPGLKEDFVLISKENQIEIETTELEEQSEKTPIDEEKEIEQQELVQKENTTVSTQQKEMVSTPERQDLEPITPEKPHRVIAKHKASPELIKKLKKGGKIGLGVLAIGAAVAALIVNPLALAGIPAGLLGGGLLYEQVKENIKKK